MTLIKRCAVAAAVVLVLIMGILHARYLTQYLLSFNQVKTERVNIPINTAINFNVSAYADTQNTLNSNIKPILITYRFREFPTDATHEVRVTIKMNGITISDRGRAGFLSNRPNVFFMGPFVNVPATRVTEYLNKNVVTQTISDSDNPNIYVELDTRNMTATLSYIGVNGNYYFSGVGIVSTPIPTSTHSAQ